MICRIENHCSAAVEPKPSRDACYVLDHFESIVTGSAEALHKNSRIILKELNLSWPTRKNHQSPTNFGNALDNVGFRLPSTTWSSSSNLPRISSEVNVSFNLENDICLALDDAMDAAGDHDSWEKYIQHTMKMMKIFRMWKLDKDSRAWRNVVVTIFAVVMLTLLFVLGSAELIELKNATNVTEFASGFGPVWLHFLGFSKWLYFAWRIDVIMSLVERLDECYRLSRQLDQSTEGLQRLDKEMRQAQRESQAFFIAWCISVFWGVIHWCMNPILLDTFVGEIQVAVTRNGTEEHVTRRRLPFIAWIPWETANSPGYELTYAFEYAGNIATAIGTMSYDIFYMTLLMISCGQFRYLNYSLLKDKQMTHVKSCDVPINRYLQQKLRGCQLHHDALLRFLQNLDTATSPIMFAQCIGTIGIVCLSSFETMTTKISGDLLSLIRFWSMMEYICAGLVQLFVFCYYASKVTNLGLEVADSTWKCGWEMALYDNKVISGKPRHKIFKNLALVVNTIMLRAQKPIRLSGGPFYVLSLDTFRAVIGIAFSYSTVLRALTEE